MLMDGAQPRRSLAPLGGRGLRTVLAVLCLTQITSWGVLYYAFAVLAPSIAADTGWSVAAVTGAFSVGQLTGAVAGIPVGRLLDRRGPRPVMSIGSAIAAPALAAVALAPSLPLFAAAWLVVGATTAAVLYQPAFAALTRWYGDDRVSALTTLTLVGGLASTVFGPLTAVLELPLGWRGTYLVLAGLLAVVTVPAHVFGLDRPWPAGGHASAAVGSPVAEIAEMTPAEPAARPRAVTSTRPFVALVVASSLAGFATYAVLVNLVPLLTERGLSTGTAAVALGLGGVGQVLGRLGYRRLAAATSVRSRTTVVLFSVAVTTGLLAAVPGPAVLLVAAATLAGTARGVFTLLQATAVTDRWGTANYGRLSGLLAAPVTVCAALAPWAGAALAGWLGGYRAVFGVLALAGAAAALAARRSYPPADPGRRSARVAVVRSGGLPVPADCQHD